MRIFPGSAGEARNRLLLGRAITLLTSSPPARLPDRPFYFLSSLRHLPRNRAVVATIKINTLQATRDHGAASMQCWTLRLPGGKEEGADAGAGNCSQILLVQRLLWFGSGGWSQGFDSCPKVLIHVPKWAGTAEECEDSTRAALCHPAPLGCSRPGWTEPGAPRSGRGCPCPSSPNFPCLHDLWSHSHCGASREKDTEH